MKNVNIRIIHMKMHLYFNDGVSGEWFISVIFINWLWFWSIFLQKNMEKCEIFEFQFISKEISFNVIIVERFLWNDILVHTGFLLLKNSFMSKEMASLRIDFT